MKALLKEPLLHFLLLGVVLFGFFSLINEENNGNGITISDTKVEQLKLSFQKTHIRPPNKQELDALINNYFKQQVAYKKGMEMGLLEGDSVVQNRIQQKFEFIIEDALSLIQPTDQQLQDFLDRHSQDYQTPMQFSFVQLYFNPEKHDDIKQSMQEVEKTLSKSAQSSNQSLLGLSDKIFLELSYTNIPYSQVARYFGSDFATSLTQLNNNHWHQNIKSGYGTHIVKLLAKKGGESQPLEAVRQEVKQAWLTQQRQQSLEQFYQLLFEEYQVDRNQS